MRRLSRNGIAPMVGAVVVVATLVAFGAGVLAGPVLISTPDSINYNPDSETKEFVILSNIAPFNETTAGIPHDHFLPHTIVVNQGDTVLIHLYNTEGEPEHHNFYIAAYNVNVDLAMGEEKDVSFVADQAGVFPFLCTYHQPTMSGELVVLPTSG